MEPSTRPTTHHRSRLTQQHRSTAAIRNRPTHHMKNWSTVVQMIGRTTTATPLSLQTPDNTCIHNSMMKTMRMNELLSRKPSLMRRIHFYIISLGKGMHNQSTYMAHHRSILNLLIEAGNEHQPSINRHPHNRKRASTYSSIDAEVNRMREGDYSIRSWADDHPHKSYAVETTIYEPVADELHEGFTYEELFNMQRRDETYQNRWETAWGRT